MNDTDIKRIESHLKRTFNTGGIHLKARPKQNDSAEVYVRARRFWKPSGSSSIEMAWRKQALIT